MHDTSNWRRAHKKLPARIGLAAFGCLMVAGCSSSSTTQSLPLIDDGGSTRTTRTTTAPRQTTVPEAGDLERHELGSLPQGGQLVWLAEANETECVEGLLTVEVSGEIVHTYDRSWQYPTLYRGPFGQLALVEYCGDEVLGLAFADAGLQAQGESPLWNEASVPEQVFHLDGLDWFGSTGFFGGDATFYDGERSWSDTVAFDPYDQSMSLLAERLGRRGRDVINGVDVIVPDGWNFATVDADTAATLLSDPGSGSSIAITVLLQPPTTPVAIGDEELVDTSVVDVALWEEAEVGSGRAAEQGWLVGVDYNFQGLTGSRWVRLVTLEDRTVMIEGLLDDGAAPFTAELASIVIDSVRIYNTVG